jgi:hypothetical protein
MRNDGKNGGGHMKMESWSGIRIMAWKIYKRIKYTEYAQSQTAVYKTQFDLACTVTPKL